MNVETVSADGGHHFSKVLRSSIRLLEGRGVEGDAHAGVTVLDRLPGGVWPEQEYWAGCRPKPLHCWA